MNPTQVVKISVGFAEAIHCWLPPPQKKKDTKELVPAMFQQLAVSKKVASQNLPIIDGSCDSSDKSRLQKKLRQDHGT